MTNTPDATPDDDEGTPVDEIVEAFMRKDIPFEVAIVRLLAEAVNGIWSIACDSNDLVEMARDDGPSVH